jgi:oligopeptide/dipeptide ABC transporter ATP-binding protein
LLIADETTRSLDATTQMEIVRLIGDLQRQHGMAIILISHDLSLAGRFADDVLVMYAGSALEYAPSTRLFARPRTPYARALLSTVPGVAGRRNDDVVLSSEFENAARLASGCPLEPRCPSATTRCGRARPALVEHELGHHWACWNA